MRRVVWMKTTSWMCLIGFLIGVALLAFSSQGIGEKAVTLSEIEDLPVHSRVVVVGRVQSVYAQSHFSILTLSDGTGRVSVFLRKVSLLENVQKNELIRVHGLVSLSNDGRKGLEADRVDDT